MKVLNNKGFTVLEALASVFVISLLLTASISIIVGINRHTTAASERIIAVEVSTRIRDELNATTNYATLSTWQNGQQMIVTFDNFHTLSPPFSINIFAFESNNRIYNDTLTIIFEAPSQESTLYRIIHFQIIIEHYPGRFLTIEGLIYE